MLYYNTVNQLLKTTLLTLMEAEVFDSFRLVGGTALSLQIGHRKSVDIDLFSDAQYGSLDFDKIEHYLKVTFPYVDYLSNTIPATGRSYTVGNHIDNTIKLDIFYTALFV